MAKHDAEARQEKGVQSIEGALSTTEQFIERNRKWMLLAVLVLVVVVSGYLAYRHFVAMPREEQAQNQIYPAQQQFEKDSFAVALNGDGNNLGFLQVMEEYSSTRTANLARYYAGICYRELGEWDKAIEMLKSYRTSDEMVAPVAMGALGDCYMEKGETDKALDYYTRAASYVKNRLTTPIFLMKRAMVLEQKGAWGDALAAYETVRRDYPSSTQARTVEKFIARAKAHMQ